MTKKLLIFGSITMMVIFIAIMGSGAFLKKPITGNDDLIKEITLVEKSVKKNNWNEANNSVEQGFVKWEKIKNRIQFSVEREFIDEIERELAVLKGTVQAKDMKTAITTVEKIKIIWEDLGK